jgi:predicted kinase
MIVIVFGLPGSGKSYFAEQLAKIMDADYVNSDRIRRELFLERTYSEKEKFKVYEAMLSKMQDAIDSEKDIVLDATFYKNAMRQLFVKNATGKVFFIEVWANDEVIKERLKKSRPYSEADFEVHKLVAKQWEPFEENHLKLKSTNDNIDAMLQKALKYLNHESDRD